MVENCVKIIRVNAIGTGLRVKVYNTWYVWVRLRMIKCTKAGKEKNVLVTDNTLFIFFCKL